MMFLYAGFYFCMFNLIDIITYDFLNRFLIPNNRFDIFFIDEMTITTWKLTHKVEDARFEVESQNYV